jgi:hypothetical protein
MTSFIIKDTLIIIYLFYSLHKIFKQDNDKTRRLEVKNVASLETEEVST